MRVSLAVVGVLNCIKQPTVVIGVYTEIKFRIKQARPVKMINIPFIYQIYVIDP